VVTPTELEAEVAGADLVIAAKPRSSTLGVVRPMVGRLGIPLVVDMDDPDLEMTFRGVFNLRRVITRPHTVPGGTAQWARLRRWTRENSLFVSNPWLAARHDGIVLPHARADQGPGEPHTTDRPTVAFIGTPHAHKGIHLLREAVQQLSGSGYRLVVTAHPPADARPWESWLGPLSDAESMRLLRDSDVVALPSMAQGWGRGQLPMKLVDAMFAARGIAVSDLTPLTWAAGDGAIPFASGSTADLTRALRELGDPAVRTELGAAARARAVERFTSRAMVPDFERGVRTAVERARALPGGGRARTARRR
jgi:glycosyltransferase involved in cell wall biosynthesis